MGCNERYFPVTREGRKWKLGWLGKKGALAKNNPARLERDKTPALVSIRYNPLMIAFYQRLKEKGKNGKVIVCAIMRKLVHVIFGVLKSGKMYDPNYKPAFV
jgi:transposase